ncbi:1-(5-phosphoribosyl)-5-[(5-phosphoribosylamino)methylideneamino]imidazole-4-carboxamide isomerase [Alkaliphilus serpentinus]|uniref:1-(5-phosphoribosyl)-5-[(5-phosphoribosylamino)methylideneamino] imidazole-4-carboxamide isomerase n=1 Tax=Alkaliphilus serpentinus TaxID=1482731 RepID=A0A833HR69_9FIRM|nr:1-(5-phosphoribosyl)-5-[(5-phosphoribosylamino)methylideneamino]imidazole-4-carboxamide isomerase [Alkaliphilus serpentinus]KAB3532718.1 1-(5-phosphoribosyl)-5-[(5-phosphoribosylamino)methylideneamino]imidazole-4-carboxamide isomerase [Alkaliphilus serpentinus]
MILYTAIDIKGGKCVRLIKGDAKDEKVYFNTPIEAARLWENKGSTYLHIVDLDGAFEGSPKNQEIIMEILRESKLPIQVGGGIRSYDTFSDYLTAGVARVIIGTKALQDKALLARSIKDFGNRVLVSVDARGGYATSEGWIKNSTIKAIDLIKELAQLGVEEVIYTDINRDGMLMGPNFKELEEIKKMVDIKVVASGGVASLEDITRLKDIGADGVIIGKALYEGKIDLMKANEVISC